MDMIYIALPLLVGVILGAVVWFGMRRASKDNDQMNDAFKAPIESGPLGGGGGPKPVK